MSFIVTIGRYIKQICNFESSESVSSKIGMSLLTSLVIRIPVQGFGEHIHKSWIRPLRVGRSFFGLYLSFPLSLQGLDAIELIFEH